MFDTVFGLPVHALVVHATVVLVPLAAMSVLVAAVWPRAARWLGPAPLLLSLVALALVPLSTDSGEALEHRVGESALVEEHAELADGLLPWVIGLVVAAAGLTWVWYRRRSASASEPETTPTDPRTARWSAPGLPAAAVVAVLVLSVATALGTAVQVARIGHSGAEAAWSDVVSAPPAAPSGDEGDDD